MVLTMFNSPSPRRKDSTDWTKLRERYFARLTRSKASPAPLPALPAKDAPSSGFQLVTVFRVPKIEEDEDPEAASCDPYGSRLLVADYTEAPQAVLRPKSVRSTMSYSNLPFGARPHRMSWSSQDFLNAARPGHRSVSDGVLGARRVGRRSSAMYEEVPPVPRLPEEGVSERGTEAGRVGWEQFVKSVVEKPETEAMMESNAIEADEPSGEPANPVVEEVEHAQVTDVSEAKDEEAEKITLEDTTEPMTEGATEVDVQAAAALSVEEATEPSAEEVMEPSVEEATEPSVEEATEPNAEETAGTKTEDTIQTQAEAAAETATEDHDESKVEVNEPQVEQAIETNIQPEAEVSEPKTAEVNVEEVYAPETHA